MTQSFPRACALCGRNKPPWFQYCSECYADLQDETLAQNECSEQDCNAIIPDKHYLCRRHWGEERQGFLSECDECYNYKPAQYDLCRTCRESQRRIQGQSWPDPWLYDSYDGSNDSKAQDKRYWFNEQNQGICNYCGRQYPYDELEVEHMIPRARGGTDHRRNLQLACRMCNNKKGTLTDLEFRQLNSDLIPMNERTPPHPPLNPRRIRREASYAQSNDHDCPAAVFALTVIGLVTGHFLQLIARD